LRRDLPLIDLRATLIDPVDLHGVPVPNPETRTTDWFPMSRLPTVERHGPEGVLFLDEMNAASRAVMAALMGLALDRVVGDYILPPGWRVVAAGNRVTDRAVANQLSSALANRFMHINVQTEADDWCSYAISAGLPAELVAFIRFRPALLHHWDADATVNATPRTWAFASRIIGRDLPHDREARLLEATVGEGPGAELSAFLKIWRSLPNVDAVLMNPKQADVPSDSAARYAITGALAKRVQDAPMEALVTYMERMPEEFGVMAMRDATTREPELANTAAFITWANDHQDLYL